jgi:hypothetical protein
MIEEQSFSQVVVARLPYCRYEEVLAFEQVVRGLFVERCEPRPFWRWILMGRKKERGTSEESDGCSEDWARELSGKGVQRRGRGLWAAWNGIGAAAAAAVHSKQENRMDLQSGADATAFWNWCVTYFEIFDVRRVFYSAVMRLC